jgi:hypothetical protein
MRPFVFSNPLVRGLRAEPLGGTLKKLKTFFTIFYCTNPQAATKMPFAFFDTIFRIVKQKNVVYPANVGARETVAVMVNTQRAVDVANYSADLAKAVVLLTRVREITLAQIKDAQQNWNSTNPNNRQAIATLQEYADAMNATLMAVSAASAKPDPTLDMLVVKRCCDWVHESAAKASSAWDATGRPPICMSN